MDDYSWIDTWGMDPLDSMYYGDLATFGDLPSFDYSTLDFPSFEDESNIFDFLGQGGGVGDSGWQINGVDVNTDWTPFNDWVEGY